VWSEIIITALRANGAFFPLDERWGLTYGVYSPNRVQQMVWLSGLLTFANCQAVFERIGHVPIPASSIWRVTQVAGARFQQRLAHAQGQVSVERTLVPHVTQDHTHQKGISMDGGMVHIRGEGWKEFKVGTVFDVELRLERDKRTEEFVERAHGVNMAYTAVLGAVDHFAPALWALAVQHDVPAARDSSVSADGAEWIWNLVADLFPDSVQVVDWYHALQHLSDAAKALFPDDEAKAQRWFKSATDDLFQGHAFKIIQLLERRGLADHAHYFQVHQRRMQYAEFQEQGYPIGSGTVESGVKQFKVRLTGPGMRWSRAGAERMLVIRAAVLQGSFDALWQRAA
jgi:hypothetical protein